MTEAPNRFLGYGRHLVAPDDIDAVVRVLNGQMITQGPVVEQFECAVAERVRARHAVAVSSGTAALHVACLAAGVQSGSLGLTSAITFVASANAVVYCGGDVRLADIDPDTLGLNATSLKSALAAEPEISVVLPVHMGGLAGDMAAVRRITGPGRIIIEDASHALGARYLTGQPIGCCEHSDMTVFSFHPVKPITTGEGGMVTTNDDELARVLRLLRSHGMEREPARIADHQQASTDGESQAPWYQEQQILGFNYRLSDIHAALGLAQMSKLDSFIARRREIARRYDAAFAGLPGIRPYQAAAEQRERSSLHLYIVDFDFAALGITRTDAITRLRDRQIGTQVHYMPIYRQPFYRRRLGDVHARFPHAETYFRGCLSLPLFQDLRDAEVDWIIDSIRNLCHGR